MVPGVPTGNAPKFFFSENTLGVRSENHSGLPSENLSDVALGIFQKFLKKSFNRIPKKKSLEEILREISELNIVGIPYRASGEIRRNPKGNSRHSRCNPQEELLEGMI